jgi:hypothetical protein
VVGKENENMSHPNEYPIDALEVHPPPLPTGAPRKASTLLGSVGARWARKWALGLILAAIVATSSALSQTTPPCYEAYRMSGFNPQQTSFEEFRGLHSDTSLCAPDGGAS